MVIMGRSSRAYTVERWSWVKEASIGRVSKNKRDGHEMAMRRISTSFWDVILEIGFEELISTIPSMIGVINSM